MRIIAGQWRSRPLETPAGAETRPTADRARETLFSMLLSRLGSFDELEDLDLEASLPDSVTLIEWGGGIAEGLADDRLEIDIRRGLDPEDETRLVFLSGLGARWADGQLEELR